MSVSIPKAPGRPRNEAHSDAAKAAALDLLREQGYAAINMETVAQRSCISRQTLYRRWPDKRALILDAFAEQAGALPHLPDTGSLEGDLRVLLRATCAVLSGVCGETNRALVAEGLHDPAYMTELRERQFVKRRRQVAELFARARQRGELKRTDDELLIDLLLGPVWYRLLLQNGPLDDALADAAAAAVVRYAAQD